MPICVSPHIDTDGNLCIYSIIFCREMFLTLAFYARQTDQGQLKMQKKGIKCYLWLSFLWKHQNSSLPWGLCVCYTCQSFSHVQLFATTRTVARQASLSMEFSRQEYWSGLPFPSLGHLLDPGLLRCRRILYQMSYWGSPLQCQERQYLLGKWIMVLRLSCLYQEGTIVQLHAFTAGPRFLLALPYSKTCKSDSPL